jgi:GntR family transcriptional regulator
MAGFIDVDPSDAIPIWNQIEDGLRRLAASGTLTSGEVVPSVRELARELRVNPATVAKAYQRLTDTGVLVVRRGEGTFIADRTPADVAEDRRRILADGAGRYVNVAVTVKADRKEAVDAVQQTFDEAGHDTDGGGA